MKDRIPDLPEQISGMADLAYNLWWSWHPVGRMLFKMMDRVAWKENGHNPVQMLKEIPADVIEASVNTPDYMHHYDVVLSRFRRDIETKICWFVENIARIPAVCRSPIFPLSTGCITPSLFMRAGWVF